MTSLLDLDREVLLPAYNIADNRPTETEEDLNPILASVAVALWFIDETLRCSNFSCVENHHRQSGERSNYLECPEATGLGVDRV
jgi:hypothetical protein